MENNQIYSSMDEALFDGSIFVVDIEENETSNRLELKGEYSLKVVDGGLSLLTLKTDKTLFSWPYTVLRRYGTSKTGFTFEVGRKSHAGPGVLRFASPSGKLITQTIKRYVSKIKDDISVQNTESLSLASSFKTNIPQGEMTEDYTEYSRTTERPHRPVPKPADPHIELALEIPREYINHRIPAGPTLSHPVNSSPQLPFTRISSPNRNPISHYVHSPRKSSYNTVGTNNTILVDSYSKISGMPSPLLTSMNLNQGIPQPHYDITPTSIPNIPSYVITPSMPLPYKSMMRPQAKPASGEKVHTLTNDFNVSCDTVSSTFPTCVSPLQKPDSGEESSDEDSLLPPAGRKISQATTSVKEITADLNLTTIEEPVLQCDDYINLKKNSLTKSLSNPTETDNENSLGLRTVTTPNYLNVRQRISHEDDYYNITPSVLEDRKRSKTDLSDTPGFEREETKGLFFSITPDPVAVSSFEDLFKSGEHDMVYGNLQIYPSAVKPITERLYVNSPPPLSKPVYQNVKEHKQMDTEYIDQPITTISQTPPPSPTKPCLAPSDSQPSIIKLKSRTPREKPISSQYSFLAEVLGGPPKVPQVYDTWKGPKFEYNSDS